MSNSSNSGLEGNIKKQKNLNEDLADEYLLNREILGKESYILDILKKIDAVKKQKEGHPANYFVQLVNEKDSQSIVSVLRSVIRDAFSHGGPFAGGLPRYDKFIPMVRSLVIGALQTSFEQENGITNQNGISIEVTFIPSESESSSSNSKSYPCATFIVKSTKEQQQQHHPEGIPLRQNIPIAIVNVTIGSFDLLQKNFKEMMSSANAMIPSAINSSTNASVNGNRSKSTSFPLMEQIHNLIQKTKQEAKQYSLENFQKKETLIFPVVIVGPLVFTE